VTRARGARRRLRHQRRRRRVPALAGEQRARRGPPAPRPQHLHAAQRRVGRARRGAAAAAAAYGGGLGIADMWRHAGCGVTAPGRRVSVACKPNRCGVAPAVARKCCRLGVILWQGHVPVCLCLRTYDAEKIAGTFFACVHLLHKRGFRMDFRALLFAACMLKNRSASREPVLIP